MPAPFVLPWIVLAGIKIAGVEFVPKDLIFADPEPKSRVTAEGSLPKQCSWSFVAESRLGRHSESQDCVRFFFKSSAMLSEECPAPNEERSQKSCDHIVATDSKCPDSGGKVTPPPVDAKALSSGTMSDGKHQDVALLPDGTRIVLTYDGETVVAVLAFPDGSGDMLRIDTKK